MFSIVLAFYFLLKFVTVGPAVLSRTLILPFS